MSSFRSYLLKLATLTSVLLAVAAGFNFIVDPYSFFDIIKITGFNASKPQFHNHLRMIKAHKVRSVKPDSIILGSSRADTGLDPEHPGWGKTTSSHYNLAMHSANIYEIYRYLQHAHESGSLKQVVIGIDFFMFSSNKQNEIDFEESRLAGYGLLPWGWYTDIFRALFTYDALKASVNTLLHQGPNDSTDYGSNGFPDDSNKWIRIQEKGGHRQATQNSERDALTAMDGFTFFNMYIDGTDISPNMQVLSEMLDYCKKNKIDLKLFISPIHVRRLVLLHQIGMWIEFENWKMKLVQTIEKIYPAAQLWDFTGFSRITTEQFPVLGDARTQIKWYWESSHYKKQTGKLILDKILSNNIGYEKKLKDFGIQLSPINVAAHLQQQRQLLEQYINQFPEQVVEIQGLVTDTQNKRKALYMKYPELTPHHKF